MNDAMQAKLDKAQQLMAAQEARLKETQARLDEEKSRAAAREKEVQAMRVQSARAALDERYKDKFDSMDKAASQQQTQIGRLNQRLAEANERARIAETKLIALTGRIVELETSLALAEQVFSGGEEE